MTTRHPFSKLSRGIASAVTLLLALGLVRPALGQEAAQAPTSLAPRARTMAQTFAPYVIQPAPVVVCPSAPPPPPEPTPVYEHASFWLSVGLALAAGVVVGVIYERRNHAVDMPTTTFGSKQFEGVWR